MNQRLLGYAILLGTTAVLFGVVMIVQVLR
jgi:hypothetical protein